MTKEQPTAVQQEEHHPQPPPDEHMCTCGRYREDCVRDRMRAMWHIETEPPPSPS